jgi:hypothetical protein
LVSEVKPSPGSRSGLKYPLELLESSRYNSFFKTEAMGKAIEICIKYPRGSNLKEGGWYCISISINRVLGDRKVSYGGNLKLEAKGKQMRERERRVPCVCIIYI